MVKYKNVHAPYKQRCMECIFVSQATLWRIQKIKIKIRKFEGRKFSKKKYANTRYTLELPLNKKKRKLRRNAED